MHNEEWGVLQLSFTLYIKNWTCFFVTALTKCSLEWFAGLVLPQRLLWKGTRMCQPSLLMVYF